MFSAGDERTLHIMNIDSRPIFIIWKYLAEITLIREKRLMLENDIEFVRRKRPSNQAHHTLDLPSVENQCQYLPHH
jgi:hypothetical protein